MIINDTEGAPIFTNMKIESLIGIHLGKTADGSAMPAYITPKTIDSSLLVAIPRSENRDKYGIDKEFFSSAIDIWNCYEFSTLLQNGYPINGIVKIKLSNTDFIVESKSLKLYLNSFNSHRWTLDKENTLSARISTKISEDLRECFSNGYSGVFAKVFLFGEFQEGIHSFDGGDLAYASKLESGLFKDLDIVFNNPSELDSFDTECENPSSLISNKGSSITGVQRFKTSMLRSNCRVTNQPDWGDVYIAIKTDKVINEEGILRYIVSLRNENHFHEEICELISKRFVDAFDPQCMWVSCLYTRRGGIDINPFRFYKMPNTPSLEFEKLFFPDYMNLYNTSPKTLRQ